MPIIWTDAPLTVGGTERLVWNMTTEQPCSLVVTVLREVTYDDWDLETEDDEVRDEPVSPSWFYEVVID